MLMDTIHAHFYSHLSLINIEVNFLNFVHNLQKNISGDVPRTITVHKIPLSNLEPGLA